MSSPVHAIVPSIFKTPAPTCFNGNSTAGVAKMLFAPYAAAADTATSPLYYGGCTLLELQASSTDAVAKDIQLMVGQVATTQETTATGNITTTTTTITRVNGSWIADGWTVGDLVSCFQPFGVAAVGTEGRFGTVTAVTATVITFTVSGTAWTAQTLAAGSMVCRMAPWLRATIPANAGNATNIANYSLLNNSNDSALMRTEKKLDATQFIAAYPLITPSAFPAVIALSPVVARY